MRVQNAQADTSSFQQNITLNHGSDAGTVCPHYVSYFRFFLNSIAHIFLHIWGNNTQNDELFIYLEIVGNAVATIKDGFAVCQ